MRLQDVMKQQRQAVHTISATKTVADAIARMIEQHISALVVLEGEVPVGIFSERDVLCCHVARPESHFREIPLKGAMTEKLIVARPDDRVSSAMAMMIQADIRHLPVVDAQRIIGMLSISDLVKHHVGQLTAELHYLQEYITDLQDAVKD